MSAMPLFFRGAGKSRAALVVLVTLLVAACSSQEERAQSYYQDGVKLLARHESQKAAIEFRNAIRLKRDLVPAWRGLAQIEELGQHWEALIPILQTIIKLEPENSEAKLKLARLLLLGGATDRALDLVDGINSEVERKADVLALKAAILYKRNDMDEAAREAQAALKIDPHAADAVLVLTAARLDDGDAKGALKILNSASVTRTNGLEVELFKGRIFDRVGDSPQAELLLRKLAELFPQDFSFRKRLINLYMVQHRPLDAEHELRSLVAANPTNPQLELDLVRLLNVTQDPEAARAELAVRISAGADVFPYQMALAEFDFVRGDYTASFKLLETLASDTGSLEHSLAAKVKLAELNIARRNSGRRRCVGRRRTSS